MSLPDLDGSARYGYPINLIPKGQADALFAAAAAHVQAMAPATVEECHLILLALRSSTIIRNESSREAEASFRMLRVHLADVPLDILEAGCRAYVNAPGPRHYPRSAGEIRAFTNRLMWTRASRAILLRRLAEQAAALDQRAQEMEDGGGQCTAEAAARILAEHGLSSPAAPSQRPEPTFEDYRAHGCTVREARTAVREQKRLRARSSPPPIGQRKSTYARARTDAGGARRGERAGSRDAPA